MPSVYYSYSASTIGTGDGSSWANACNSISNALSTVLGKTADGTPYVINADSTSTETLSATTTLAGGTTPATRVTIYSVNKNGSVPPAAADITPGMTIGSAAGISVTWAGFGERVGVIRSVSSGGTSASVFDGNTSGPCGWVEGPGSKTVFNNTNASTSASWGSTGSYTYRVTIRGDVTKTGSGREPKIKTGNAAQTIRCAGGSATIRNALMLDPASTAPPTNFFTFSGTLFNLDVEAADFTGLTANLTTITTAAGVLAAFRDCLIPTGVALVNTAATIPPNTRISAVRSSAVGAGFSNTVVADTGGQNDDTTVVMTGGAGVESTLRSWHVKSTATAALAQPYEMQPSLIYNQQTGTSVTVAIEGIWNSATSTLPTNAEIWLEVEEVGQPGAFHTNGLTNELAAPVAHAAGTGTWNGVTSSSVGANPTKFRMQITFTTSSQAGYFKVTPKIARASAEYWLDPKPIVSGGPAVSRSFNAPDGSLMNETQNTVTNTVSQFVPVVRSLQW